MLGVLVTIAGFVSLLVGVLTFERLPKWFSNPIRIWAPVFYFYDIVGFFLVAAFALVSVLHYNDNFARHPLGDLTDICFLFVLLLVYCVFVAPKLRRVNILAWVGWEQLDRHLGALSASPLQTRFRALYYSRGISSSTELYDRHHKPFHIVILDVERLLAAAQQTRQSFVIFRDQTRFGQRSTLIQRVLDSNSSLAPSDRLVYGVPVRFGFNEVLYSQGLHNSLLSNASVSTAGTPSMSQLRFGRLHEINADAYTQIIMWDWYLPTLSTLFCAYAAEDSKNYCLSDVYSMDVAKVFEITSKIITEIRTLRRRPIIVSTTDQLQKIMANRETDISYLVIGFGSMAIGKSGDGLCTFIPHEGVLTWVEFASVVVGNDEKIATDTVRDVILSLAIQVRLIKSDVAKGLPASNDAYEYCERKDEQLIMATAKALSSKTSIPLVMRRLPGMGPNGPTSEAAKVQEAWETAWASIRVELVGVSV